MNDSWVAPLASPTTAPRPLSATAAASPAAQAAQRERVAELAREFEAMMLRQVLQQMRETLTDSDSDERGLGADTMTATIDVELTRALAVGRPIGLAAALQPALER